MPTEEERKKVVEYQLLQNRLEGLNKQRELLSNKILEINESLKSIDAVEPDDQIIFSLGSNTYGFGKLTSNKFLVEIGADVILEKNKEEAKKILTDRKVELEQALKEIERDMISIARQIQDLERELQKMVK